MVQDSVDQRVKQYTEFLHSRRQPKQKKELASASAFSVKGKTPLSRPSLYWIVFSSGKYSSAYQFI